MPDHAQMMELARSEFAAGRLPEAARLLEQALDAAPDLLAAHIDLGAILIALGRPEEAAQRLRTAVALSPASVEAQVNLGNALHAQGRLDAAELTYRTAFKLDPKHVRGLLSLGNLLCQVRRPAEALQFLSAAVALAPGAAAPHQFLGNALRDSGRGDEAVASYRRALAIDPALRDANESLGILLNAQQRFAEALACFQASGNPAARALGLECQLRLGRSGDFFAHLETRQAEEAANLHSAALSAYAAFHLDRPDPHRFCPDPLGYVRVVERYTGGGADADFLRELIRTASDIDAVWEPRGVATVRGFQTGGNLFATGDATLARLNRDLVEELQRYRAALPPSSLALISQWPGSMRLRGWFVRLLTGGHQYFHNHPFGWMSGCVYLQMPAGITGDEGAIEFGLEALDYPPLSTRAAPTLLHNPRPGEIVLFPSSLYHRTVPFRSDEERLCIAFDLLPE